MEEIKVSIIVPIYNAQEYLMECLRSIIKQTLSEIEIICVDDGSTDNSCDIVRGYAKNDQRIKLILQKNQYAGVARNNGFKCASGEYVVFWDSDDYFDEDALEKLYIKAKQDDADIAVCGARRLENEKKIIINTDVYLKKQMLPEKCPFNKHDISKYIFNFATNVPWNKMYRREFIIDNNILFQDIRQANDTYFVLMTFFKANSITVVDDELITYRVNNKNSLTGKALNNTRCAFDSYVYFEERFRSDPEYSQKFEQSFVNRALSGMLNSLNSQLSFETYVQVYNIIRNEALEKFKITNESREYYYTQWQYDDMIKIKNISAEELLFDHYIRDKRNLQVKKAQYNNIKTDAKQESKESKQTINKLKQQIDHLKQKNTELQSKIKKKDNILNCRSVKIALWIKKILTFNGKIRLNRKTSV